MVSGRQRLEALARVTDVRPQNVEQGGIARGDTRQAVTSGASRPRATRLAGDLDGVRTARARVRSGVLLPLIRSWSIGVNKTGQVGPSVASH